MGLRSNSLSASTGDVQDEVDGLAKKQKELRKSASSGNLNTRQSLPNLVGSNDSQVRDEASESLPEKKPKRPSIFLSFFPAKEKIDFLRISENLRRCKQLGHLLN